LCGLVAFDRPVGFFSSLLLEVEAKDYIMQGIRSDYFGCSCCCYLRGDQKGSHGSIRSFAPPTSSSSFSFSASARHFVWALFSPRCFVSTRLVLSAARSLSLLLRARIGFVNVRSRAFVAQVGTVTWRSIQQCTFGIALKHHATITLI